MPITSRTRRLSGRLVPRRPKGLGPAALSLAAVLLSAVCAGSVVAQSGPPSPKDVLGWDIGERFTDVNQIHRYLEALAAASDLVSVHPYGETNEGRPLVQVVIATPGHRDRLEEILRENRELTDPDTPESRAAEIISENPGVVYFSYGVHGNESSSSEAAIWTAWDLARGSPDTEGVLDRLVVVLDPVVNPDGRTRYVNGYRQRRGIEPDPNPSAREHREAWPGGRYNHYLFDLNRDWAWMTQKETRARLATWDRWTPLVHVDFHEMGYTSEYFFFPAAKPINPIYPDHVLEWGERIGAGNAEAFDAEGWLYFTRQTFDLFYPGYGDSWPSLTGAIGMTYEQAGGGFGGLAVDRPDGTTLTLTDRATHHRTAGKATLRTAAEGKVDLMSGFAEFHRSVDEGFEDVLLVPGANPGSILALVRLLRDQGIEVEAAEGPFRAGAESHPGFDPRSEFPAGTIRVRARQPRGRLAMALLWPEHFLDAEFSYDITSWSLPYIYGVEAHTTDDAPEGIWRAVDGSGARAGAPSTPSGNEGRYGYLVEPDFAIAPGLVDFLEAEGVAYAMTDTFTLGGDRFPRGTVFLPRGFNSDLDRRVESAGLGGLAHPISTGLTEGGSDLGSGDRIALTLPVVGLLSGEGTTPTSVGAHWIFLEQRLGIPFHQIQVSDVESLDLDEFDVLIAPGGRGLTGVLGEEGMEALQAWIEDGGTLVAVDGSARSLGRRLLDIETREDHEDDMEEQERLRRALRTREERDLDRWTAEVPGTILPVSLDPSHPLSFGAGLDGRPGSGFVLSSGFGFEPDEEFESPIFFPADLEEVSGVISEDNLARLSMSSWLVQARLGSGRVILFADDPLFRMFWYRGFQPYTNAILFGSGG